MKLTLIEKICDIFVKSEYTVQYNKEIELVLVGTSNNILDMMYKFFKKWYNDTRLINSYYINDDFSIAKDLSKNLNDKLDSFTIDIIDSSIDIKLFRKKVQLVIDILDKIEKMLLDNYLYVKDISIDYIISMDKIDNTFHKEILNNELQIHEWESFNMDITNTKSLYIDTKYFGTIKGDIISSIKDKENGILIKSDNLKALNYLYENNISVDFIYIDPPYNTNLLDSYKNRYYNSTWNSLMYSRLYFAKRILNGTICCAIDDLEFSNLQYIMDYTFGKDKRLGNLVIVNKPSGRTIDKYLATCHEYCLFYGQSRINFFELSEYDISKYVHSDDIGKYKWRDFLRTGGQSTPDICPNQYYPIYYTPMTNDCSLDKNDGIEILPIDSKGNKRVWRKTKRSFLEHLAKKEINFKFINGKWKVQLIDRIKDGTRPKSVWFDAKYDSAAHGTKLLKSMFGESNFSFPKSIHAVYDVLYINTLHNKVACVLDFFAGSGTTGHAVLKLNKERGGNRKFILVEKGEQFDNMIIPRLKRLAYSMDWRDGTPINDGTSVFIKIMRL